MTAHKQTVEAYFQGFRTTDRDLILSLLTDDVRWDLPGFRHLTGKAEFDSEIVNEQFEGRPTLVLDRLVGEGDVVVAIGSGAASQVGGPVFEFAYCDVFTFDGDLIARVESYLVPLGDNGNRSEDEAPPDARAGDSP